MSLQYYRFFPGDYARDTRFLSLTQHGAYRLLIDEYMTNGPLPNALDRLYRICGAQSNEERNAIEFVLTEFFVLAGPTWRHKRCDLERLHQLEKSTKARESIGRRWATVQEQIPERSKGKPTETDTNVLPTNKPSLYGRNTNQYQNHISPDTTYQGGSTPSAPDPEHLAVAEKVLLDCPAQRLVELYHQKLPTAPQCLVLTQARRGYLRARWREYALLKSWQTEIDGLDFFGEFFDFVARSKFLTGRANGRDGRAPFIADMEWLFRPGNFAKVIEGKYHA